MSGKVEDERVGFEIAELAYKISLSFAEIGARITSITDRFVTTANDIIKQLVDWFELPPKLTAHLDKTLRSVFKIEKWVEIFISFLWVTLIVVIAKFVLEIVFESLDVCVFCSKRQRRLIPLGSANRTASVPLIWRAEKKIRIKTKKHENISESDV